MICMERMGAQSHFRRKKTSMGHAEYASEGLDFSTEIYSHFNDVRESYFDRLRIRAD